MKKWIALLCALILPLGLAACGSNDDGKVVRYDDPVGYELYDSNDASKAFVVYAPDGGIQKAITLGVAEANDGLKKGIESKNMNTLEAETLTEFDDNLQAEFVTIGDYEGLQILDMQNGAPVEITYYLIAGDWVVLLVGDGTPESIDEVHADMRAMLETVRLEEMTFGG